MKKGLESASGLKEVLPAFLKRTLRRAVGMLLIAACAGCLFPTSGSEPLRRAEELSREGRYDEAIIAYREHMSARLAVPNRPEWENPYFYLLLIGDIELRRGDVEKALVTYEEAERQGVHETLISDRYRSVATWYENSGELEKAMAVLVKYRERDSLLFDSMLDRIGRELSARESVKN